MIDALAAVHLGDMGAQFFVEAVMLAFVEQMQIEIGKEWGGHSNIL